MVTTWHHSCGQKMSVQNRVCTNCRNFHRAKVHIFGPNFRAGHRCSQTSDTISELYPLKHVKNSIIFIHTKLCRTRHRKTHRNNTINKFETMALLGLDYSDYLALRLNSEKKNDTSCKSTVMAAIKTDTRISSKRQKHPQISDIWIDRY